jgi:glycerol-3-phosphate acyltransferase PlsY
MGLFNMFSSADINYSSLMLWLSLLALLIGGIPFGRIIARWHGIDISTIWSGNHGATNVYRALWMRRWIITALLDMFKGAVMVFIAQYAWFDMPALVWIATVVVIGSIWSVYLGWAGGKGVATAFGTLLMLVPMQALILLCTRLIGIKWLRVMSLTNLILVCGLPLLLGYRLGGIGYVRWVSYMLLLIYTHRTNIVRLWIGSEGKL